ncbi:MAG: glutamate-cysteine ligase family protein [Planctomycetia bacterium]
MSEETDDDVGADLPPPDEFLHLFAGYGVEIEWMIVDVDNLNVAPLCDRLFERAVGRATARVPDGPSVWSNELAAHVVEVKTAGPKTDLAAVARGFTASARRMNELLALNGARLLPTAMHPWMDPRRETKLWPHGQREIYHLYDRIFDTRGHGWSNLQSMHLNLPFFDDAEFGRLMTGVRLLVPLLPALAASSPFVEGRRAADLDHRMAVYRNNQTKIPQAAGRIVPERVFNTAGYESDVLQPIYDAFRPYDPAGLVDGDWVNSRGAIARFERQTIEIRVIDAQECPRADVAVAALAAAVLQDLCIHEKWRPLAVHQTVSDDVLVDVLNRTIVDADEAMVTDGDLLACFGLPARVISAGDLWRHLSAAVTGSSEAWWTPTIAEMLRLGPLARRLTKAAGPNPSRPRLEEIYGRLADGLTADRLFEA